MKTMLRSVLLLMVSFNLAAQTAPLLVDGFSDPALKGRRATRGEWKYAEGVATCTQDDELYKKHKNHGPIIFYDLDYQDAEIRFSYKVDGAKSVVFTCNNAEGHVFRFVSSAQGTTVRAFPPGDKKPHTSVELDRGPALVQGQWVDVVVRLQGAKVSVKIGPGYEKTVEHPAFAVKKSNLSVGFAFGTFHVKGVEVRPL